MEGLIIIVDDPLSAQLEVAISHNSHTCTASTSHSTDQNRGISHGEGLRIGIIAKHKYPSSRSSDWSEKHTTLVSKLHPNDAMQHA